jgi:hypothetical protein
MQNFIEWCVSNKENLIMFLVAIGGMLEAINALFPSKNKDSMLEKIGRLISKITHKLPAVVKKDESKTDNKPNP